MGRVHSIERGRGQEIRIQAKEWDGKSYIDIRQFVRPKDGTELIRALEAVAEAEDVPF